jgi:hypothetical protein
VHSSAVCVCAILYTYIFCCLSLYTRSCVSVYEYVKCVCRYHGRIAKWAIQTTHSKRERESEREREWERVCEREYVREKKRLQEREREREQGRESTRRWREGSQSPLLPVSLISPGSPNLFSWVMFSWGYRYFVTYKTY